MQNKNQCEGGRAGQEINNVPNKQAATIHQSRPHRASGRDEAADRGQERQTEGCAALLAAAGGGEDSFHELNKYELAVADLLAEGPQPCRATSGRCGHSGCNLHLHR